MSDQIETLPQLARLVAYLTNATVYLLHREEERLTRLGEDESQAAAVNEELAHVRELIAQIAGEAREIAEED